MKCLCCDNVYLFSQEAVMAPFISKITNQQAINTSLIFCMKCGFSFFQHRYSESELNLIYSGYRGDYYLKLRQTVEPNYSQKINDGLGGVEIANQRKKLILDNLKKCSINPNSILDYGGDRGQMIPTSLINDESYVYDISNENLVHGVKRLELNEIRLKSIDLVMINHTLEHMTDFVSDLDELMKDLADGAYIYIELPYDSPFLIVFPPSRFLSKFSKFIFWSFFWNPKFNLLYFKFKQTIKSLLKFNRPVEMHEHINFFTKNSLINLMIKFDIQSKYIQIKRLNVSVINSRVLTYIGQKKARKL